METVNSLASRYLLTRLGRALVRYSVSHVDSMNGFLASVHHLMVEGDISVHHCDSKSWRGQMLWTSQVDDVARHWPITTRAPSPLFTHQPILPCPSTTPLNHSCRPRMRSSRKGELAIGVRRCIYHSRPSTVSFDEMMAWTHSVDANSRNTCCSIEYFPAGQRARNDLHCSTTTIAQET